MDDPFEILEDAIKFIDFAPTTEDGLRQVAVALASVKARVAELEALLPRVASLHDAYWKALTDCDLGCCFDPLIERLSKDAKNLTR